MSDPVTAPVALPGGWRAAYAVSQPPGYASLSAEERSLWESLAAEYLHRWTGRRFGLTPTRLRPIFKEQRPSTFRGAGPGTARRWYSQGSSLSISCGRCGRTCACSSPYSIILPGPVHSVESVTIDGVALPEGAYQMQGRTLTRIDGSRWPAYSYLTPQQEASGRGWEVNYTRGAALPDPGAIAVGTLAIEFWKAYTGDRDCQLPTRLSSITREGVSVTVLDTFEDLDGSGHTGIWLVDSWVASVTKTPLAPVVASPDLHGPRIMP